MPPTPSPMRLSRIAAARLALMHGIDVRDPEAVRKFYGGLGGRMPGEVPPGGTPDSVDLQMGGASVLPLIAASRVLPSQEEQWANLADAGAILQPPYDPWFLVCMVEESDVLPTMIDIYATNLSGFGTAIKPLFRTQDEDGAPVEAPPESVAERAALDLFLGACNVELGFCGVLDLVDRDCETTGYGCLEVLRDRSGIPAALEHVPSYTVRLGHLSPPILVDTPFRDPATGQLVILKRWRRFRTYVQVRDMRTVYFKQFGDPRHLNCQTGAVQAAPWGVDTLGNSLEATELVMRRVYSPRTDYGIPRWIGASPSARSGRQAAELIYSWFNEAPIGAKLAMVAGGAFQEQSLQKLLDQIDEIRQGTRAAWGLLALEATTDSSGDPLDDTRPVAPKISLEDLAYDLPADLYKEGGLMDRAGRRVASTFRLPPVYWGASDDFSRAAVASAIQGTEEQTFVPLRNSRWNTWINHELLPAMGINFWSLTLRGAPTSDDADILTSLTSLVSGGGASPNALIEILNAVTGQDRPRIAEPWADRPLQLVLAMLQAGQDPNGPIAAPAPPGPAEEAPADRVAKAAHAARTVDALAQIRAEILKISTEARQWG